MDEAPPTTEQEARELVVQIVENGLSEPDQDLQQIIYYLPETYAKRAGRPWLRINFLP